MRYYWLRRDGAVRTRTRQTRLTAERGARAARTRNTTRTHTYPAHRPVSRAYEAWISWKYIVIYKCSDYEVQLIVLGK